MKQTLKEKAKTLPDLPGVYLMKDSEGTVIYVGKSKQLRRRVSSYFGSDKGQSSKVKKLVRHIKSIEYEVVDTELDALLRECTLIKELKPIYNRLLKEDKKYCYIVVNKEEALPRARLAYEKGKEGIYFGPYDRKQSLEEAIEAINLYYGWPTCKEVVEKEGCLSFLRGRCLGFCEQEVARQVLASHLQDMFDFLRGKHQKVLNFYKMKMEKAANQLEFEEAAQYRNIIGSLKALNFKKEAIAYGLSRQKGLLFVPKPLGGIKVYGLLGTTILFTEHVFRKEVTSFLREKLQQNTTKPRKQFTKQEIDEVYIIYSYLRNTDKCTYISWKEKEL
ncbi:hypothetical protein CS063_01795 [Sporanaerobium hydrogeniformans]|uniref:Uncharacterized protein n=1 Tax=Sporanaerobium hydrogeniformans TaxID=3072179 RepID=A0AC61DHG4_9FIRM|nr:GIY-YIG nuclease family protein [Sporanaerobium hydrogeniformans]PHV72233.1 hypothetical protein CS063_01795 [Sporanaerobium hydrogeniformans]